MKSSGVILRKWQKECVSQAANKLASDGAFVVEACTGSGKTTLGVSIARKVIDDGACDEVVVICPSVAIKAEWVRGMTRAGIDCTGSSYQAVDVKAVVVTMSGASSDAIATRINNGKKRLVIVDEFHHAERDKSWGEGVENAVDKAECVLFLSGTPWRTTGEMACLKRRGYYDKDGCVVPDFRHTYEKDLQADSDNRGTVHAEFVFLESTVVKTVDGKTIATDSFPPIDDKLSTADENDSRPLGPHVRIEDSSLVNNEMAQRAISRGITKLIEAKNQTKGRAIGLVVARTIAEAKRISVFLTEIMSEKAEVVASPENIDDATSAQAAKRIAEIKDGKDAPDWIVSVGMISEGVDIPEIKVVVYLSAIITPLYVTQVVGRAVRRIKSGSSYIDKYPNQTPAYVIMPAHPFLVWIASKFEEAKRIAAEKSRESAVSDSKDPPNPDLLPEYKVTGGMEPGVIARGKYIPDEIVRMLDALSAVPAASGVVTESFKMMIRDWLNASEFDRAGDALSKLCEEFGVSTDTDGSPVIDYDTADRQIRKEASSLVSLIRFSHPDYKKMPDQKAFAGIRARINNGVRLKERAVSFEAAPLTIKREWVRHAQFLYRQCIQSSEMAN